MIALRPAERILIGLGITDPKEIDLEAVAWSRGAAVKFRPLDKCEAMIVGSQRRAIITVNSESIPVRQRFSLAHEIGHWHHHRGRVLFCGAREIGNPANSSLNPEHQADEFASDLILPNYLFGPRMKKLKRVTLAAARELADEFHASLTATLLKLVKANLFPILIVCHTKARRRWFQAAPMLPGWWFPREELDSESFAFEMLFSGVAESSFPRKIGAGAWFTFRNADRYEIQEQSFLLPNDEVLTVLAIPEEGLDGG
jgi:Zn-dependent peptidase ImmA (M78 family)